MKDIASYFGGSKLKQNGGTQNSQANSSKQPTPVAKQEEVPKSKSKGASKSRVKKNQEISQEPDTTPQESPIKARKRLKRAVSSSDDEEIKLPPNKEEPKKLRLKKNKDSSSSYKASKADDDMSLDIDDDILKEETELKPKLGMKRSEKQIEKSPPKT